MTTSDNAPTDATRQPETPRTDAYQKSIEAEGRGYGYLYFAMGAHARTLERGFELFKKHAVGEVMSLEDALATTTRELSTLRDEAAQLREEVTRLTRACEQEFASVQQLSDDNARLRDVLRAVEADKERRDWLEKTRSWCHAGRDGDCGWKDCPQIRDGEPHKTGRHCPLDTGGDDE